MSRLRRNLLGGIRNLFAVVGFWMAVVSFTPVTLWMGLALMGPWREPRGETLVVLGADGPTEKFLGWGSYWRAFYAARAWKEGGWKTVVLCGGNGIAESMRDLLVLNGVPAERILVEAQTKSTRENAAMAKPLLAEGAGRIVVLTTDYHTYRSGRVFQRLGLAVETRPAPYILKRYNTPGDRWGLFLELSLEWAKIGGYWWRGWI